MNEKPELQLEPVEGELQPIGKMPTLTPEQVNVIAVIQSVSKVEVLANTEETMAGIVNMKSSYLPIIKKAKAEIANAKTKADFDRSKEYRLAIRAERLNFTKSINAELAARKLIIDTAKKGKEKVEEAFESLETELNEAEKPVDEKLKAAAAAKKALADALAKLKNHTINPLIGSDVIEAAIDDFRLAFGNSDYQESQDAADEIFESKMAEFETILAAAVVREENERKIKKQEEQSRQRANISVSFPIDSISCYGGFASVDIQARIDLINKVDMSQFDLVLPEAETAKQSCLNMLNAFLPMTQEREAKEAAAKAEAERLEREKQAELDAKSARKAAEKQYHDDWDLAILQYATFRANKAGELIDKAEQEAAIISVINDDAGVAEDLVKIMGEPCFQQSHPLDNSEQGHELLVGAPFEITGVVIRPLTVMIPVDHLRALIFAAEQAIEYPELNSNEPTRTAIEFAKSLI